MTSSSLIAFALVFLVASVGLSLALGLALRLATRRLRGLGARAEKRAAVLTLVVPPLLGLLMAGVLAMDSVRAALTGADHCLEHSHHLHICLFHGAEWATRPWAVELLAVVGGYGVARLIQILWTHAAAQRAAWRFRRLGDPIADHRRAVLVPLEAPMVFTVGALSPTVVVSRGAWDELGTDERRAVLAHEQAHIAAGDLWRRALLGCLACIAAPGLASHALRLWERSAERICDRHAAGIVGRPSIVARAIVSLARRMGRGRAPAGALCIAACEVTDRVHSLLDGEADGATGAARLSRWCLVAGVTCSLAAIALAEQLHHLLETILG